MPDSYLIALYTILISYVLGSVPFGLILTRLAGLGDIRAIGSGNIGATNVLRTGNKKIAALVLLLDGIKGYAAVYIIYKIAFQWLMPDYGFEDSYDKEQYELREVMPYMLLAGLSAVLGHIFPVWLKFKGGKGVATAIGTYLAIDPVLGGLVILIWLTVFLITKVSSLSALCGFLFSAALVALLYEITTFVGTPPLYYIYDYAFLITAIIFWRHKDNIKRLLNKTEPRFGEKK